MLQEASTCQGPEKIFFFPWACLSGFDSVMPAQTSETASRAQGGVVLWFPTAAVAIEVAIALQSVNTSETLRCQLRERSAV